MKKDWKVLNGNNIDILKTYEDNTFDSIVTDPPYGIEFLGKDWDKDTGAMETWQECLRVLKPGGYILAFSAARTYHNLATNIESAGFEIRDQIMWLYASGFPKAQDMGKAIDKRAGKKDPNYSGTNKMVITSTDRGFAPPESTRCVKCDEIYWTTKKCKHQDCGMTYKYQSPEAEQWAGWKTALKPAHEPIVMARKPFKGSCIDNVLNHGVGALNIDASRVPFTDDTDKESFKNNSEGINRQQTANGEIFTQHANIIGNHDVDDVRMEQGRYPSNVIGEVTDYQKFFYCPKVGRAERHVGFEQKNIAGIGAHDGNPMGHLAGDKNSKLKKVMGNLDHIPTSKGNMLDHSYDPEMKGMDWHDYKQELLNKGNLDHIPFVENSNGNVGNGKAQMERPKVGNNHPTVKPVELMKYLVKLVTPEGGIVLDPFNGSGSTGMACVELGYEYIGCELDPSYVEIATNRIAAWEAKFTDDHFDSLFDK